MKQFLDKFNHLIYYYYVDVLNSSTLGVAQFRYPQSMREQLGVMHITLALTQGFVGNHELMFSYLDEFVIRKFDFKDDAWGIYISKFIDEAKLAIAGVSDGKYSFISQDTLNKFSTCITKSKMRAEKTRDITATQSGSRVTATTAVVSISGELSAVTSGSKTPKVIPITTHSSAGMLDRKYQSDSSSARTLKSKLGELIAGMDVIKFLDRDAQASMSVAKAQILSSIVPNNRLFDEIVVLVHDVKNESEIKEAAKVLKDYFDQYIIPNVKNFNKVCKDISKKASSLIEIFKQANEHTDVINKYEQYERYFKLNANNKNLTDVRSSKMTKKANITDCMSEVDKIIKSMQLISAKHEFMEEMRLFPALADDSLSSLINRSFKTLGEVILEFTKQYSLVLDVLLENWKEIKDLKTMAIQWARDFDQFIRPHLKELSGIQSDLVQERLGVIYTTFAFIQGVAGHPYVMFSYLEECSEKRGPFKNERAAEVATKFISKAMLEEFIPKPHLAKLFKLTGCYPAGSAQWLRANAKLPEVSSGSYVTTAVAVTLYGGSVHATASGADGSRVTTALAASNSQAAEPPKHKRG